MNDHIPGEMQQDDEGMMWRVTMQLRWFGTYDQKKIQQLWVCREKNATEWRDIPFYEWPYPPNGR